MHDTPTKRAPLVRVQLVKERTLAYETAVCSASTLASVARAVLSDDDRERFVAIHLNTKHKVLSVEVVAMGTLNATLVHPREVFKGALLANAAAVCLAHNHPSGDPTPSPEDHALTRTLREAGAILGIQVLDHVVLGDGMRFVSLRDITQDWREVRQ